jgi:ABC-2 type transport system ATP-binding protein
MMGEYVVETQDLTKKYGDVTAVNGLNLRINRGDIFGFLGPNGAGKTTTILMLLGLTEPTSGSVFVAGFNSTREPLKVKRVAGYVPDKVGFYDDMTAENNLFYTARLNGLSDEVIQERINDALGIVGLPKVLERKVGEFSLGMKQRLAIADILVKMPDIAIMDEPTSGIDPEGISHMLDLIARIAKEKNMTIIMSSHQLYQVQRICTRVGMLMNGQMVAEGPIEELGRTTFGEGQFRVEVKLTEVTDAIIAAIKEVEGVLDVEPSDEVLSVTCSQDLRPQIARAVINSQGMLVEMKIESYALEDIYLKYFKEG